MKTTRFEDFRRMILETGKYVTAPENRRATPAASNLWNTLRFSRAVCMLFPMCGIKETFHLLTQDVWARECFKIIRLAEKLGATITLDGWENRAAYHGPVVYLANHMSTLETVILPPVLLGYDPISIIVKESLMHIPICGGAARHMGLIGISRKNPREDFKTVMTEGAKRLSEGTSMLIFPQGTRQSVFDPHHFSSIGAKLAERAGVPVVPVAVRTDIMQTSTGFLKDFGRVDASRPISLLCGPVLRDMPAKDLQAQTIAWLSNTLAAQGLPVVTPTSNEAPSVS